MALTFPITPDGLEVDVLVNLEAPALITLRLSGAPATPIPGRGLIDTGSDITAVSLPFLQRLGAPIIVQAKTQSIGGTLSVNLYRVSLHVFDSRNVNLPWLSYPTLTVMELAPNIPCDVLIGLDIIGHAGCSWTDQRDSSSWTSELPRSPATRG